MKTFRIFLSSPGDVATERAQARELLLGLARNPLLRGRVHIDVVSWDDPHGGATMDARLTPQQAVDRSLPTPAECDLTVVLLWGRMGTPLAEPRADGSPYLSGTEWEFENALAASRPVLVYRRTEKVLLDSDDPEFDEKLRQKRRVEAFFGRFKDESGALLRGHATYKSPSELVDRLRQDVERHLSELLHETDGGPEAAAERVRTGRSAAISAGPPDVPIASARAPERGRARRAWTVPVVVALFLTFGSRVFFIVALPTAPPVGGRATLLIFLFWTGLCFGARYVAGLLHRRRYRSPKSTNAAQ